VFESLNPRQGTRIQDPNTGLFFAKVDQGLFDLPPLLAPSIRTNAGLIGDRTSTTPQLVRNEKTVASGLVCGQDACD
jgi:hypothetical protein